MTKEITVQEFNEREMISELEGDFERFPLPICFDPMEEQVQFYGRYLRIERAVRRFIRMKTSNLKSTPIT